MEKDFSCHLADEYQRLSLFAVKELPAKGMLGCSIKAKSSQPHNPSDRAMPFIFNPKTDQLGSKLAGILFSLVMKLWVHLH